ncbi:MAG TPA: ATP-binding protein [Ilumatobacter sp.]|nr:ATP-binding protein [Ilumatobacter sp.]
MIDRSATMATRSQIVERLRPASTAWSVNGREVEFVADFDLGVEPGGLLIVTTPAGARVLVQVHALTARTHQGVTVDVDTEELGIDQVHGARVNLSVRIVEGSGVVLGALDGGEVVPFDEAGLERADDASIAGYHDRVLGDGAGLEIGTLRSSTVPARLKAAGFARHTFMCGQSGSGKTFSLGVVLERLLYETELPVIIVDPNSDYVNLGKVSPRAAINRFARTPMTRDEYATLNTTYPERADVAVASARHGDLPLTIHLSDLTLHEQALTMQLDPIADPDQYHALVEATAAFGDASYDVEDIISSLLGRFDEASRHLAQRIANLGLAEWSVWARSDEPSLVGRGRDHRVLILDTGSLATAYERSVVSLALLGRLRRRPDRSAVSVVIDEAHNVCPPDAGTRLEQAVTDLALWIAGEGRKYGIYLLLSTQRPQKIHRNVLSQCDNLLLMRVNSASDLDELATVFSHVPASLIAEARAHRMGEMLAAGPIAPTPLRLQMGVRWTREGGADLPTAWATRP